MRRPIASEHGGGGGTDVSFKWIRGNALPENFDN